MVLFFQKRSIRKTKQKCGHSGKHSHSTYRFATTQAALQRRSYKKGSENMQQIPLWHRCFSVNCCKFSEHLFLRTPLEGCFCNKGNGESDWPRWPSSLPVSSKM